MRKASIILLIAMLLSLISACGNQELTESNSSYMRYNSDVSVWYVDDSSSLWTNFQDLSRDYNASNGKNQSVEITSRSFPDDKALVNELLDTDQPPSIVLCSGETAAYLDYIGIPQSTSFSFQPWQLADFDQNFLAYGANDNGQFSVPLAFSPDVLIVNNTRVENVECYSLDSLSTIEGINELSMYYKNETGSAFFTAESFSCIIRNTMAASGEDFHAKRDVDIVSDNFKYAYNLLAQIAFYQSLIVSDTDASQLVLQGNAPCAIVRASSLMKYAKSDDADSVTVLPYPSVRDKANVYGLHFCSALITAQKMNEQHAAAEFLSWLCLNGDRLTADTGYLPAYAVAEGISHADNTAGDNAVYQSICRAYAIMEQYAHPYRSGNAPEYYENWWSFEQDFRGRMLNLLDF